MNTLRKQNSGRFPGLKLFFGKIRKIPLVLPGYNKDKEQKTALITPTALKCFWGAALTSHNDKKYNQWVILECKHLKDHITHNAPYLSFSSHTPLRGVLVESLTTIYCTNCTITNCQIFNIDSLSVPCNV